MQVEEVRPVAARDLQRVAKTLGGDQPNLDTFAFGQRVDDDRRAVGKKVDQAWIDTALFENIQHSFLEIRRRRVGFGRDDAGFTGAMIGFEADQVGEGSADIRRDADRLARHHWAPLTFSSLSSRQTAPGSFNASAASMRSGV
jgi:hypothetical protein